MSFESVNTMVGEFRSEERFSRNAEAETSGGWVTSYKYHNTFQYSTNIALTFIIEK